jgi:CDP-diacylglycerol--glycerol-3-phosphate 3-phosphatidyltransferase
MFDGRWRKGVDRTTGPIGQRLVRLGVTADMLTVSGLVFALATAVVVATGHLLIGIPLLTLTGFHDLLDGPVAKAGGTASVRGAFFDSVSDRLADAVVLGGVAWYLISAHKGHLALLPLAILGVTSLVSYQRAKAEALGIAAGRGGLMERAERMILLGVGFLAPWLLVPDLWVLLGLTTLTAVGRFVRVWKAAQGPDRPTRPKVVTESSPSTGTRWSRAWREGNGVRLSRPGEFDSIARWRARRQEALAARGSRPVRSRRAGQSRDGAARSLRDAGHRGRRHP